MLAPLEAELLRRVDAVVATAKRLVDVKVSVSGRGYHLPQGVNYEHFATARPCPPELAQLPRPIIGFAGGVGPAETNRTISFRGEGQGASTPTAGWASRRRRWSTIASRSSSARRAA